MTFKICQLQINGMHCFGCEETISEAVKALPGIHKVEASYRRQTVEVSYDDTLVNETAIRLSIEAKGYDILDVLPEKSRKFRQALMFLLLLVVVGGVVFWGCRWFPKPA